MILRPKYKVLCEMIDTFGTIIKKGEIINPVFYFYRKDVGYIFRLWRTTEEGEPLKNSFIEVKHEILEECCENLIEDNQ